MLSAKKSVTRPVGSDAGSWENHGFRSANTKSSTMNATSHGPECLVPNIASAASGVMMPHRMIPLEATNPPSDAWSSAGSTRKHTSWVVRNTSKRFERASTRSPISVIN